ncbi:MAG: heparinase II/III family protein [Caulobacteraceae bacterium]|nr:heparinase II/III family protein [Caulobacteraceae bacterium]
MDEAAPVRPKPANPVAQWGRIFRPALTADFIRQSVRARPQRPYELLEMTPMVAEPQLAARSQRLIAEGWSSAGRVYSLKPPMPWTTLERGPAFDINSWKPLTRLLATYSLMGVRTLFDAGYAVIRDWVETFHPATTGVETPKDLDAFVGQVDDPVWYDMSVGVRAYRLAYALEVRARDEDATDDELELLAACLYFHLEALARPRFFKGHSNHGLYQALGQLSVAQRFHDWPKMREYAALSSRRLEQMIGEHFFASGVHNEHSPGYHYMLLGTFVGARNSGVLTDAGFIRMLERMEEALTWMIMPDSTTVPLGDTDVVSVWRRPALAQAYANRELQYLLSSGKTGLEPKAGVRAWVDAGYAFARLKAEGATTEEPRWSYLAQTAGFHSRTHKQADDMAFHWWDKGRNLLVDPGRYAFAGKTRPDSDLFREGFWYSDPRRIYVETTRAHNTVEVDGRSFPRVDVEPYGSGVVQAVEIEGLALLETRLTHFSTIDHRRILILRPGAFLLCLDWLQDREGRPHHFSQRFHLAADLTAAAGPRGTLVARAADGLALSAADLTGKATLSAVDRGREEPELLGWMADKANSFVPTTTFAFEQTGPEAVFATAFSFAADTKIPPGTSRIGREGPWRFNWIADGRRWAVSLREDRDQPISARLDA